MNICELLQQKMAFCNKFPRQILIKHCSICIDQIIFQKKGQSVSCTCVSPWLRSAIHRCHALSSWRRTRMPSWIHRTSVFSIVGSGKKGRLTVQRLTSDKVMAVEHKSVFPLAMSQWGVHCSRWSIQLYGCNNLACTLIKDTSQPS